MVEVVNRQRTSKLPSLDWIALTTKILELVGRADASVTIAFVSDRKIRDLNRMFRGLDKSTDVLSFPSGEDGQTLGDVAISIETAKVQAKRHRLTLERELAQLILHGVLHLFGYDHETDDGEMNRLELRLRRRLKI